MASLDPYDCWTLHIGSYENSDDFYEYTCASQLSTISEVLDEINKSFSGNVNIFNRGLMWGF